MTTKTAAPPIDREILEQETAYYDAVTNRDGATVARLTADECVVLGENGVRRFNARAAGAMAKEHDGRTKYAIDDDSVNVLPIDDNTAVIAYKLVAEKEGGGGSSKSESYDASLWVRKEDGRWACAMHVEAPARPSSS